MYKVISITGLGGKPVNIDNIVFTFVGKDYAIGHPKGFGDCFSTLYSKADCYTVITEKI